MSSRSSGKAAVLAVAVSLVLSACDGEAAPVADTAQPVATTVEATPAEATAPLVFVTDFGVGDLRAGMTLDEARRVMPELRLIAGTDSSSCSYLEWPSAPPGVLVMFDGGRLARFDIDSAGVRTEAGAQVGDAASRVDSIYAGRLTKQPHKYTDGEYFQVAPMRAADSLFRLVFEVEGGRVTRYRVGTRPQVEYVEGCS
jgi:hypothetical protein